MIPTQLFVIAPGLWHATSLSEIAATCGALRELGLYHLPYDRVAVRFPVDEIIRWTQGGIPKQNSALGPSCICDIELSAVEWDMPRLIVRDFKTGFVEDCTASAYPGDLLHKDAQDPSLAAAADRMPRVQKYERIRHAICDFLIAMLATRNAVKETREDKLAKLGIGKKRGRHVYRYVTTISLPPLEELEDDAEHPPTGRTVAPHLRRGHIRRQHYGPARAYVKQVWIAPVFVKADPDFVSKREAYNLAVFPAVRQAS